MVGGDRRHGLSNKHMKITVTRTAVSTSDQLHDTSLGFGNLFSDHMLLRQWRDGAWGDALIQPREPLAVDPTALALHYGQTVFEGMKAYRGNFDDRIRLFRPQENAKRLAQSSDRLAIPLISEEDFIASVAALVKKDKDWVPRKFGEALYIRPLIFASEGHLAVRPATQYTFVILTAPVAPYFPPGRQALRLKAEPRYTRAVTGGTGFAKTAGNYAATLKPMSAASAEGFDQILWLDAHQHSYVEEAGQMNIFFRIGDEVLTPDLSGTILPGVTRDSVIQLLKDWNCKVSTRRISISELEEAAQRGLLKEMWGAGTAAVVAPIASVSYLGREIVASPGAEPRLTKRLLDTILGIQYGEIEDPHGWSMVIECDET